MYIQCMDSLDMTFSLLYSETQPKLCLIPETEVCMYVEHSEEPIFQLSSDKLL
jgi:hypothetical protein